MLYDDGTLCYRLLRCTSCGVIVNRDSGGGTCILAQAQCILHTGKPLWGAQRK